MKADDLDTLLSPIKDSIIVGDFNAKSPLWGSSVTDFRGKLIVKFTEKNNLICLNTGQGTRINNSGSLSHLDLAFCNESIAKYLDWNVLGDCWGSDHFPILINFQKKAKIHITENTSDTSNTCKWKTTKADWDNYNKIVIHELESKTLDSNLEIKCNEFLLALNQAAECSIPKLNSSKKYNYIAVPYWNKDCSHITKSRKKALKIFRKFRSQNNRIEYKKQKAKAQYIIRNAKTLYWNKFCDNMSSDTKLGSVWSMIKRINGCTNHISKPIILKDNKFINEKQSADLFAREFINISANSNLDIDFTSTRPNTVSESLFKISLLQPKEILDVNSDFNVNELNQILTTVNINSAPGPDGITFHWLTNLPIIGKLKLLEIINQSWHEGKVPNSFKSAIVKPIIKPGKDPSLCSSYRPISLTNSMAKIAEKLVVKRLENFLNNNELFNVNQAGFRKNHCTIDHIIRLKTEAEFAIQTGNITVAIFLDFTRAFDLLWVDGLVLKLMLLGLRGKIISWIKDFLTNRSTKVKIGNSFSDAFTLDNGTPQGTSLSPILFAIMINDFPTLSKYTSPAIFADDCTIWRSGTNLEHITTHLQDDLNKINKWCTKWGFKLNNDKTIGIVFTNKTKLNIPSLFINNKKIKFESKVKFLGVVFDHHLTWKPHILEICDKSAKRLNLMRSLTGNNWGSSRQILLTVYKSLIRSIIDYGAIVYKSASKSVLKILDTIQYKALLIATGGIIGTPLSTLLAECGEKSLNLRREELLLKYISKIDFVLTNPAKEILRDVYFHNLGKKSTSKYRETLMDFYDKYKISYSKLKIFSIETANCDFKIDLSFSTEGYKQLGIVTSADDVEVYIRSFFPEYNCIFVDGSKSNDHRVGIGVSIPRREYHKSIRLPDYLAVYTAESAAILEAIDIINSEDIQLSLIISDSLSVLKDIECNSSKIRPHLINSIYNKLSNSTRKITLLWIPSHIGYLEHDKADSLAKAATNIEPQYINHMNFELEEIHNLIEEHIYSKWINVWKIDGKGRSYKDVFHIMKKGFQLKIKPRAKERLVMRLRMHCSRLNAHLAKINLHPDGLCDDCKKLETTNHFILECSKTTRMREELKSSASKMGINLDIENILSNPKLQTIVYEFCNLHQIEI
jgi:ribonuclease HI